MPSKLSDKMTKKQKEYISKKVKSALTGFDLKKWQKACKSLAPLDYSKETRTMWYEKFKDRVSVGKKIVEFYDSMAQELRDDKELKDIKMKAIRAEIVDVIRTEQAEQGLDVNRLNSFKIATFRTLISWHSDPDKLEEGPYEGKEDLPKEKKKSKRSPRWGRKTRKGDYNPPIVKILDDVEVVNGDRIRVTLRLVNKNLHPFQNIDIELDSGPGLSVTSVKPFRWRPSDSTIHIDFLEAELTVDPLEKDIIVEFEREKKQKRYTLHYTVRYDNCDQGTRDTLSEEDAVIKL